MANPEGGAVLYLAFPAAGAVWRAVHRAKLIIEVDGDTHDLESAGEMARTAWLEALGYRVLRFSNDKVGEWQSVERTVAAALGIGA